MRAILTWHSIDTSGSPISVAPAEFARQVAWLQANQVRVTGVRELLSVPPDEPAVALTFDDGFANFASHAAPILSDLGWPVTLFVVPGHVGRTNQWGGQSSPGVPDLPLLDWDALGRLHEGGVTIGAHTRTHPRLDRIGDPDRLRDEMEGCAEDIETRLGQRPEGMAYPYGALNPGVAAATARCFRWACTTELRPIGRTEDTHCLPRVDAWYLRNPARLGGWGSPRVRSWLMLRHRGRRLKALLQPGGSR